MCGESEQNLSSLVHPLHNWVVPSGNQNTRLPAKLIAVCTYETPRCWRDQAEWWQAGTNARQHRVTRMMRQEDRNAAWQATSLLLTHE